MSLSTSVGLGSCLGLGLGLGLHSFEADGRVVDDRGDARAADAEAPSLLDRQVCFPRLHKGQQVSTLVPSSRFR